MSRQYKNPPVVEALCEIYFTGSRWDTTIPGIFYSEVQSEFPIKTELEQLGLEVQLAEKQVGTRMVHGDPRVRFSRRDGSRMVQLGRDLLVVNQLRPYPHYDDWRPTVIDMQAKYRKLVMPLAIQRFGVRYINRVIVPGTPYRWNVTSSSTLRCRRNSAQPTANFSCGFRFHRSTLIIS